MEDKRFSYIESLNQTLPRVIVDAEDGLVLLDIALALFIEVACFLGN